MKQFIPAIQKFLREDPSSTWRKRIVSHWLKEPVFVIADNQISNVDDLAAIVDLAMDEQLQGTLPFPYSSFTVHMSPSSGESCHRLYFVREREPSTDIPHAHYIIQIATIFNEEVGIIPATFIYVKNDFRLVTWIGPEGEFEPPLDRELFDLEQLATCDILTTCMLLRMSYARTECVDMTEENKRRIRMNRAPLPRSHIVIVDTEKLIGLRYRKGGTHSSPTGHLRRAHLRRMSSGKMIQVRSAAIKGGPTISPTYLFH